MFSLIESFRSAIQSIRAHTLRSFLTTLGIIIGVASVIAVVSVIQGMNHTVMESFKGLGSNSLTITSYTSNDDWRIGKRSVLTMTDYQKITEHIDDIKNISPSFMPYGGQNSTVSYGSKSAYTQIQAVTQVYQQANQTYPALGRFINDLDVKSRRRVAVVGDKLRENLNLPRNPVGEYLQIGRDWFKIIGVTEARGEMFGFSQDDYVLIPFSTGEAVAGNSTKRDIMISFEVNNIEQIEAVQDRVKSLLRQTHRLKPGEPDDFRVRTAKELTQQFENVVDTMTLVLGGIVSISLLVGGIGIMNIMLVSVTERTREIGICKALGAQRHHILSQFLIEATTLSLFGGAVGVAIGYGLGVVVAKMIPDFPDAHVPLWAIGISFGFSSAVGIIFGIMPAFKAANLEPIDALRYE